MFRLFTSPSWFNGWDIIIDVVILLVAFLIAAYSWRVYRMNKENRYAYFTLAFLGVAFSVAIDSLISAILYYLPVRAAVADTLLPLAGQQLQFSELFYRGAFFLQMLAMLSAWLLIFFISQKSRERLRKFHEVSQIALFIYLVLLISIVSNFKYFVFYLTSTVLLGLIVLNYYKSYLTTNNRNAFRVMIAFLFILVANVFFIFVFLVPTFYVLAEIFLLLGFLQLLATYMRITSR